ncbi:hypothetical protein OJAV_G00185860 [Oryzias javanicus]|uniref:Ig-like domain-containing protein n=1 Tax=Oryzias javanicus TaxID=123683 RepID=A0A437CDK5_ORYJA|nr:hypothetical protein OJAV_G00185860 [Oryzias javanicus]
MLSVVVFVALLGIFGGCSAGLNITAEPGQDVILRCEDPGNNKIILLEWSKKDLVKKKMFVIRNGRPLPADQHESFKNRVYLLQSDMKDGDLSVVLKNVTVNDTGTYECRVLQQDDPLGSPLKLISSINLQVSPPGKDDEDGVKDGTSRGLLGLIVLPVLVVVLVLVLWIYRKKSRGSPAESSDKQMDEL